MGEEKHGERAEGSKTIMGRSGSLLTVIVSHSRTIYESVSQNMCCGIVFSGLPHR